MYSLITCTWTGVLTNYDAFIISSSDRPAKVPYYSPPHLNGYHDEKQRRRCRWF